MRKDLLDVPIDWIKADEVSHLMAKFVTSGKPHHIATVNAEFVVLAQENKDFANVLQETELNVADGAGLVIAQTFLDEHPGKNRILRFFRYWATGLRHVIFPGSFAYHRITGVDLANQLMHLSAEFGWKVFLLGGLPGVADTAGNLWRAQYPELQLVGTSDANPDDPDIIERIKEANPDVLFVAYGAPKQEFFIHKHAKKLHIPIMVGVGGTFDYWTGNMYRAPKWVRSLGFEWLIRLIQQPKRIKRIWRSLVTFSDMVVKSGK